MAFANKLLSDSSGTNGVNTIMKVTADIMQLSLCNEVEGATVLQCSIFLNMMELIHMQYAYAHKLFHQADASSPLH